ncbi:GNAT family N-acetyltransferase [Kurthia senegalensis]|uniref:GNAT family N-acetyltransferase n=1 Tax=Kurthia senegalensis TaxID=1033740 RepID=UPI000287FD03|nr:GNAT family N-acetyltransferase [Kurthia senegalensis]
MVEVKLRSLCVQYAEVMAQHISVPAIRNALALSEEQCSVKAMIQFIRVMTIEEMEDRFYSRLILNEKDEFIGVISLKNINEVTKSCHISTWIAEEHWGKGYNQLAKIAMLEFAFHTLQLTNVFAGARIENIRSRQSQRHLPYMSLRVEKEFPNELRQLELLEQSACILNVVRKENFMLWQSSQIAG